MKSFVRRQLMRREHSYIFTRVAFNRCMPFIAAALFLPFAWQARKSPNPASDVLTVVVGAVVCSAIVAYFAFFQFRHQNSIRVTVSGHGIVYRDETRIIRAPKRLIHSIVRPSGGDGRVVVKTDRGDFAFDYRMVNGFALARHIEKWIADPSR